MLYPAIYEHLVVTGPCPNLFWQRLPLKDQLVDFDGNSNDTGLAVSVTKTVGRGATKYLGEETYQSPNPGLGMVSDSGIEFTHAGLLFEARAKQSVDLAAETMLEAVLVRMMELVGGAILPADPNHAAFDGWHARYGLPEHYDLREEITWVAVTSEPYKFDLDPQQRVVVQCAMEISHSPFRDLA